MTQQEITRKTKETDIYLKFTPDGKGIAEIDTGCGFLDHMLTLFCTHSRFSLKLTCRGDMQVDAHHTTEDIGIVLGTAFLHSLGDKRGIARYADIILPMDEALVLCAVDISGRAHLSYSANLRAKRIGNFDTELAEEFFEAFVRASKITLHIKQLDGKNTHHIIEGMFKAFARVLKAASEQDLTVSGEIPSSKGVI
ncbi:MAG: imidazoleglycerol-phosphate dehydratase HisB [Clostridia bacterium]|nr:imidazoleglycerol-phosphate dehydratase HisB [Clostridia bacterium]